jgi:hypothetical protein
LLRGGSPSAADRILATRYGVEAVHLADKGEWGQMVALQNNQLTSIAISEVAGKMRPLTVNDSLIKTAVSLGICLGVPVGANLDEYYRNPAPKQQSVSAKSMATLNQDNQ